MISAISAASNIWCTRESSCSVGRLEGRTSSQTGFEGGQFEIQILIGPDPTENPPQWFLFHYRHTDPHFWREWAWFWRGGGLRISMARLRQRGRRRGLLIRRSSRYQLTFSVYFQSPYCHILIEQGQLGRVLKPWSPGILSILGNNASHLVNPQSCIEIPKSSFRKEEEGQWT